MKLYLKISALATFAALTAGFASAETLLQLWEHRDQSRIQQLCNVVCAEAARSTGRKHPADSGIHEQL